jgi:uncharacterized membrane protein HdeD (DUF308 family)
MPLPTQPVSRGHAALRGVLTAAVGGLFLTWPGITIGTVAVLFAVYAFTEAGSCAARAFGSGLSGSERAVLGGRAVLEVGLGVAAIAAPGVTASILTVLVGIFAISTGVNELVGARALSRVGMPGSGWLTAGALLSVGAGVALVVWPGIGAVTLALLVGGYLVVYGITLLVAAAVTGRDEPVDAVARA